MGTPLITWNPHTLLAPLELDSFYRDNWGQRECLVSGRSNDYYSALLSVGEVDSVLAFSTPEGSTSTVRLVKSKNGTLINRPVLHTSSGIPNSYLLYRSYADEGYTITIDRLDLRWKPIAILCRSLEHHFHHPVAANLYLTPGGAQGFLPHFDTHDVFILQLHGSKVWRLYPSPVRLPLAETPSPIRESGAGEPLTTLTLRAGDLLYLPRGQVHEAFTSSEASLHLTLGIYVFRWADLLAEALAVAAKQQEGLRESLPPGFLTQTDEVFGGIEARLHHLLQQLVGAVDGQMAVDRLARRLLSHGQPLPDGHFVSLNKLDHLGLASTVLRRQEMFCRIVCEADSVSLHYPGNIITGPTRIEPALRFIASSNRFAVHDLPDCLTVEDKVVLVRRLVREGLLSIQSLPMSEDMAPPHSE